MMKAYFVIWAIGIWSAAPGLLKAEPTEIKTFLAAGLHDFDINNSIGNIDVVASADPNARVEVQRVHFDRECRLLMERTVDKLTVTVRRESHWSGVRCEANFKVALPHVANVRLRTGIGNLTVHGLMGAVDFKTGTGTVAVDGVVTSLFGVADSGNVEVHGLTGNASVRTGSGNIELHYTNVPESGRLQIKTASGYSKIFVPSGAHISTNFKARVGELVNEVGDTPHARFSVAVRATSGNLLIKKAM